MDEGWCLCASAFFSFSYRKHCEMFVLFFSFCIINRVLSNLLSTSRKYYKQGVSFCIINRVLSNACTVQSCHSRITIDSCFLVSCSQN
jgi:hypothetical protein